MTQVYAPGPKDRTVRSAQGDILEVPRDWEFLVPGDAALTRRVKAAGDHWVVQETKGRKVFTRGLWAPTVNVQRIRTDLELERAKPTYAKRRAADQQRREKTQTAYVEDFFSAVVSFLGFHPDYVELAERLARAVTEHATPVGSGTVARTQRIAIEQRAEMAVIAWMRHQTTAYDDLSIPRVKGQRREVRRLLARRSHRLLDCYRRGEPTPKDCPLRLALR